MTWTTLRRAASLGLGLATVIAFLAAAAQAGAAPADRSRRLDCRGDRIDRRLDRKAARAREKGRVHLADRLDRRGDRIDRRLDRKGRRIDRRLDRRARRGR